MNRPSQTQTYFENEASDFDAAYGGAPNKISDFIRRVSYIYNKKPIEGRMNALAELVGDPRNRTILEVGCGPGFYSIRLAQSGGRVTAIDYAASMVELATRNARNAGVQIQFRVADILSEDFDQIFDSVFATGVVEYIAKDQHIRFLKKLASLSNNQIIVSFPKAGILHAFIRSIWLRYFKKVRVTFFRNRDIIKLAREAGLEETARIDVGILWVLRFKRA